ncbi:MAG TPA: tetratricopeptide repeat protein [Casimicrobiaceae bacterium]|nr:tetratricopeptide repeat protein [Casimicrobiaceae bacterium]
MAADDYSQKLDALWNFGDPATSETVFRAEAAHHPPDSREALEATTQIARALGLQKRFTEADRTLDGVQPKLPLVPARVRVRYLLEHGRRDNSSGNPSSAMHWFEQALAASADDKLPDADFYRIDTLHMLAIAAPSEQRLEWHRKALAAASASTEPRAQGWRASLLNNYGWTLHDQGDHAGAVDAWREALALREAKGDVTTIRIARWTVARGLRSLGRLDEAYAIQKRLADELQTANAPDGYVCEELAEIEAARGNRMAAKPWAAKALALLGNDADFRANEPARLARLTELAAEGR